MSKLSLEALKLRAEAVASEELLASISGGTNNDCHDPETGEGIVIDGGTLPEIIIVAPKKN